MNYCANCGQQLPPGAAFCSSCGATIGGKSLSAQQGLAQAGLEVQTFNGLLIIGRLVGIAVALAFWWFVIGPNADVLVTLVAFFVLAFVGLLAGQWVTLKLIRG